MLEGTNDPNKKKYRVILWDHILDTGRNVNNIKKMETSCSEITVNNTVKYLINITWRLFYIAQVLAQKIIGRKN